MPRAKDNRKPVGTEHCQDCSTLARFYQVQKGNRAGFLYRRCECGADQSTGGAKQARWLASMSRTGEPMIPHPFDRAPEPIGADPVPEPEAEPAPKPTEPTGNTEGSPTTETAKKTFIGFAILGIASAVALFT